jgi:RNA polymerase sigma-70 factor (ECF subfamily)
MGRHAGDGTAPGSEDPAEISKIAGRRRPLHADLFAPPPGSAAARVNAERNAQAFERLIEPHREPLREFIFRVTDGDEAIAESILKETLYRVAQEPGRYLQRPAAIRPSLILTARKVIGDGERYAPAGHDDRPFPPRTFEPATPEPAPSVPAGRVVDAIEGLASEHRELLVDVYYRGVSIDSAAADRGLSVRTIKSRLHFAMRDLSVALGRGGA